MRGSDHRWNMPDQHSDHTFSHGARGGCNALQPRHHGSTDLPQTWENLRRSDGLCCFRGAEGWGRVLWLRHRHGPLLAWRCWERHPCLQGTKRSIDADQRLIPYIENLAKMSVDEAKPPDPLKSCPIARLVSLLRPRRSRGCALAGTLRNPIWVVYFF